MCISNIMYSPRLTHGDNSRLVQLGAGRVEADLMMLLANYLVGALLRLSCLLEAPLHRGRGAARGCFSNEVTPVYRLEGDEIIVL
jgi:hypothetical protein